MRSSFKVKNTRTRWVYSESHRLYLAVHSVYSLCLWRVTMIEPASRTMQTFSFKWVNSFNQNWLHVSTIVTSVYRKGRDSVIGTATQLWEGRSGICTPVGTTDLFLLQNVHTGYGVHPAFYSINTGLFGGWDFKLTVHLHLRSRVQKFPAWPTF